MRRRIPLLSSGAAVLAFATPAASTATAATLQIPRPAGGTVSVDWPLRSSGTATLAPGTRLRVAVSQSARGKALPVTISLVRGTAGRGDPVRSKTLRHGVFAVRVPRDAAGRYTLAIRTRHGWRRSTRFEIRPATPAPAPAPAPPSSSAPVGLPPLPTDPCVALLGTPSSTLSALTVGPIEPLRGPLSTTATQGAPVRATLTNTGPVCTAIHPATTIDRLVDGAWIPQPAPVVLPVPAIWAAVPPGTVSSALTFLDASAPAGAYRLRVSLTRATLGSMASASEPKGEAVLPFDWAGPPAA